LQPNGDQLVNGLLLPAYIPDGSPARPGITNVFALAIYPMQIQNVVVTKIEPETVSITHSIGVAHVPINLLPPDIQKQLNYGPHAASHGN